MFCNRFENPCTAENIVFITKYSELNYKMFEIDSKPLATLFVVIAVQMQRPEIHSDFFLKSIPQTKRLKINV